MILTPTGAWAAGAHGTFKQSMERNFVPGDGTNPANWHTCIDAGCNDGTYWDTADGNNYGTPGAANLSMNDPTAVDFDPNWRLLIPKEMIIQLNKPVTVPSPPATSTIMMK